MDLRVHHRVAPVKGSKISLRCQRMEQKLRKGIIE